jgi:hypothetical protein
MIAKRIRRMDGVYAAPLRSRILNEQEKFSTINAEVLAEKIDELARTACLDSFRSRGWRG